MITRRHRGEYRTLFFASLELMFAYVEVNEFQRAIIDDGINDLQEYIFINGEWTELVGLLPVIDPTVIILKSMAELNAMKDVKDKQRVIILEGSNKPKEYIYSGNAWHALTPELPLPLIVLQTISEMNALTTASNGQRVVIVGESADGKVVEYIKVNGSWELFVNDESSSELIVIDSYDNLLLITSVENHQRAIIYDGTSEKAEEYVYINGNWVKTSSVEEAPKSFVVYPTYDDLLAVSGAENEDRAIVFDGSKPPVEYVYLDSGWRKISGNDEAEFGIYETLYDLTLQTNVYNGVHAFVKESKTEYVYVNGEWLPVFTLDSIRVDATQVNTSNVLQFISKVQKDQITLNQNAIQANVIAINNLKRQVEEIELYDTNDKVGLTASDTPGYLMDKIGSTIKLVNGVLEVEKLLGQNATVDEINQLSGIRLNIQQQIDSLSRVGNFTGSVETYSELTGLTDVTLNSMVIVLSDETKNNVSTIYMHNGISWEYVGDFKIDLRDFFENPININTETTGILSIGRYVLPKAKEIKIDDVNNNYSVDDVESALAQNAVNIKNQREDHEELKLIVDEIGLTGKEVFAVKYRQQLPIVGNEAILYIVWEDNTNSYKTSIYLWNPEENAYTLIISSSVSGRIQEYQQQTKLGVVATTSTPRLFVITIAQTQNYLRGPISILKFTKGANNVLMSQMTFDYDEVMNFEPTDNIEFDGIAKLKSRFLLDMEKDSNNAEGGYLSRRKITRSEWPVIHKINVQYK